MPKPQDPDRAALVRRVQALVKSDANRPPVGDEEEVLRELTLMMRDTQAPEAVRVVAGTKLLELLDARKKEAAEQARTRAQLRRLHEKYPHLYDDPDEDD